MTKTLLFFLTIFGLSLACGQVPMSTRTSTPMLTAQSVGTNESGVREGSSFVGGAQGLAKQKPYRFRSVDYPGAGGSEIYDFNGKTAVGDTIYSAITFYGTTYQPLIIPGGTASIARGINTSGDIVGNYADSSGQGHGFLYDGSLLTNVDVPGVATTIPWDINDAGLIVGQYIDNSNNYQGFLYNKGTFTAITFPGATGTSAFGINSNGDIVGAYYFSTGSGHGFLLRNGSYSSIDHSQAYDTAAFGINDAGTIAGYYLGQEDGANHGFTYTDGVFTQMDVPGAIATFLYRINNKNNVVGTILDSLWEAHGIIGH